MSPCSWAQQCIKSSREHCVMWCCAHSKLLHVAQPTILQDYGPQDGAQQPQAAVAPAQAAAAAAPPASAAPAPAAAGSSAGAGGHSPADLAAILAAALQSVTGEELLLNQYISHISAFFVTCESHVVLDMVGCKAPEELSCMPLPCSPAPLASAKPCSKAAMLGEAPAATCVCLS